jgi:hypothetical protein
MSTAGNASDSLVNKGIIATRASEPAAGHAGKTFIVTGLNRSGTSMVASILQYVGIFMGAEISNVTFEDEMFWKVLTPLDRNGLQQLIRERDAAYGTWGFKYPMLCAALGPVDMALFNNPHIIVPFRDPVSVSVRTSLSEYQAPMQALRQAVNEQADLTTFVEQLRCPSLLLSYEKSLIFPGDFVDAMMGFCGLPQSPVLRERLIRLIEPNRQAYIAGVRRTYEGHIEGFTNGFLYGWCRLTGTSDPVTLELFADDRAVLSFVADLFRQDLLDARIGNGHHGFSLDLNKLGLRSDAVLRIKVATHGIELEHRAATKL